MSLLDVKIFPNNNCPPPRNPTPGEWAQRFVRRSLHDRLGEHLVGKAGPDLDDLVLTTYRIGNTLIGHPDVIRRMVEATR